MSYTAGARVRTSVVFTPETGNTVIGNVTARAIDAEGNAYTLTPVANGTDTYYADITIPDAAIDGPWSVRWECSAPKIVAETSFAVIASGISSP